MNREFVYTQMFNRNWEDIGLGEEELRELESLLCDDPKRGAVIPGTGRARKVRFGYGTKGKSGSARVIYVDLEITEKICFLAAYAKSDKENLTEAEKKILKGAIEILVETFERR